MGLWRLSERTRHGVRGRAHLRTTWPDSRRAACAIGVAVALLSVSLVILASVGRAAAADQAPTWSPASPADHPPPLLAPTMAFDTATDQLLLVGYAAGDTSVETWTWADGDWSRLSPASSPPATPGTAMAYDPAEQDLVLFDGEEIGPRRTWTWNGSNWTESQGSERWGDPLPRTGTSLAFDSETGQMILFGGELGHVLLDDTWLWTGTVWQPMLTLHDPPGRANPAMAYDPRGQRSPSFRRPSGVDLRLGRLGLVRTRLDQLLRGVREMQLHHPGSVVG